MPAQAISTSSKALYFSRCIDLGRGEEKEETKVLSMMVYVPLTDGFITKNVTMEIRYSDNLKRITYIELKFCFTEEGFSSCRDDFQTLYGRERYLDIISEKFLNGMRYDIDNQVVQMYPEDTEFPLVPFVFYTRIDPDHNTRITDYKLTEPSHLLCDCSYDKMFLYRIKYKECKEYKEYIHQRINLEYLEYGIK